MGYLLLVGLVHEIKERQVRVASYESLSFWLSHVLFSIRDLTLKANNMKITHLDRVAFLVINNLDYLCVSIYPIGIVVWKSGAHSAIHSRQQDKMSDFATAHPTYGSVLRVSQKAITPASLDVKKSR